MELMESTEMQVYMAMIQQKVKRNWARPGTAREDLSCVVIVRQDVSGNVIDARISDCTTNDEAIRRSVIGAVNRAAPLPRPSNPLLFLRTFEIEFTYDD